MIEHHISRSQLTSLESAARRILAIVSEIRRTATPRKTERPPLPRGNTFGARLADARKTLKIKQYQLAASAGMTAAQLCQIERDHISPSVATAQRLSDALGIDVGYLISGKKERAVMSRTPKRERTR